MGHFPHLDMLVSHMAPAACLFHSFLERTHRQRFDFRNQLSKAAILHSTNLEGPLSSPSKLGYFAIRISHAIHYSVLNLLPPCFHHLFLRSMPNRYSHSGVLAQYCKLGFISLPEELYLAYIRASSVGSLATQSQLNTTSKHSSTEGYAEYPNELTRANGIGSPSPLNSVHHDQWSRGRNPAERPQLTLSRRPSSQDQAALIHSFINEINNEIHLTRTYQPRSRNNVDAGQHFEKHGVLTQEPSHADPLSYRNWSPLSERSGATFAYPYASDFDSSSTSATETTASDDYALDVPSDLPVHTGEATMTPHRTRSTIGRGTTPNTLVAQQDAIVNVRLPEPQPFNGPESRSRPTSSNVAKFPPGFASLAAARQAPSDYSNVRNTGVAAKPYPPSSYVSVPTQTLPEGYRSSSKSRNQNQRKTSEDNSLPPISDSVSKTGVEVVDIAALLSDYESGAKISEYEAAPVKRLPSPQPTLPAGSIASRRASPLPTNRSNETRKMQLRGKDLSRPVSTISSDTQIYAPLSSAFPADSSYINEASFTPESPVVGPRSLPESAIKQTPSAATQKRRSYSRERSDVLHALPNDRGERLGDSSAEISSDPGSASKINKYALVYRDRKQEWLQDPAHNVAHFRSPLRRDAAGHRRFASSYTSLTGEPSVAQRLDFLPSPSTIGTPPFQQAEWPIEFDARSVSEASTSASSGFYPPDIARYRDESSPVRKSESILRSTKQWREDSAMGSMGGSGNSPWRKTGEKKGIGLLKKLRGVSMSGIP